jgi:hypothetical protein
MPPAPRRRPTDEELLAALSEDWQAADLIQRSFREHVYDQDAPTVQWIGTRLSALAHKGLCEKIHWQGGGLYRQMPDA